MFEDFGDPLTTTAHDLCVYDYRGGSSQIWLMNADGSGARQVTNLSTEADGVIFSPDGKNLLFTSLVYPECSDDACNREKVEAEKSSKVKAASGMIEDLEALGVKYKLN